MTPGKPIAGQAFAATLLLVAALAFPSVADDPAERVPAARVDDSPIYVDELEPLYDSALDGRPVSAEAAARLMARTLRQLIDRRLVEGLLRDEKLMPSAEELAMIEKRARDQLAARKHTLAEFLAQRRLTEPVWRDRLAWQAAWDRYLARELTDAALEDYFREHRRDFDGTLVRVGHIFFKPRSREAADIAQVVARARAVRAQITAGRTTFAEAAREHSDAPSKVEGGDVGLVPRHGLMAESFAAAAFALKTGELSEPVTTPFGVHLIQVGDEQPGALTFGEVRDKLRGPAAAELFAQLAERRRSAAKIEYTSAWPHE